MEASPSPSPRQHPGTALSIDIAALTERARALQRAAQAGASPKLLRGKKFGLVCGAPGNSDCDLFDRAATELGAQVARIQPRLNELSTAHDVQQTAHLLGRLYDAVICEGLPAAVVLQLRLDAGIPVHDHLATLSHDITASSIGSHDDIRFVLQALLLNAME